MSPAKNDGIFISYRRQESSHVAGRLYDHLVDLFGTDRVFIDVDKITPGANFVESIDSAVANSSVMLAIVGPHWLTATDERGNRRLNNPDDIVRLEIEAALSQNVLVVPILVEGATMPSRQDLPANLAPLVLRHAHIVRHESFRQDVEGLVASIGGIIRPSSRAASSSGTADQRRWKLEPVASTTYTETVRLSSGTEAHEISYKYRVWFETITVDGALAFSRLAKPQEIEHPLAALTAILGTEVVIRLVNLSNLAPAQMILKVGDQLLVHEFQYRRQKTDPR